MRQKKPKLKSIRSLKKALWKLVSFYVRFSKANFNGMVQCYTCLKWIPAKEANAGHFIHNKLDFDLRNLKPQCTRCNLFKRGNLGRYAKRLIIEIGIEWMDKLEKDADKKGNDYSRQELEKLKIKFKELNKQYE